MHCFEIPFIYFCLRLYFDILFRPLLMYFMFLSTCQTDDVLVQTYLSHTDICIYTYTIRTITYIHACLFFIIDCLLQSFVLVVDRFIKYLKNDCCPNSPYSFFICKCLPDLKCNTRSTSVLESRATTNKNV